jgi:dienelactone hydrolase
MSCCPDNSEPARPTAAHVSSVITVGNTTIYRAGPATAKVGFLSFPDVFGVDSGRTKQDADALGALGYAVALVDFTNGDYAVELSEVAPWVMKQDFEKVLLPRIREAITHLQEDAKVEAIASFGYCWGSWIGARLSAEDEPLIKGHVSFHPSWAIENMFFGEGQIEELAKRIKVPQLLLPAANDKEPLKEGGSVQKILSEASADVATRSKVIDFPDMKHGWVNRGDISDAAVQQDVTKAWALARAFLQDVTAQ